MPIEFYDFTTCIEFVGTKQFYETRVLVWYKGDRLDYIAFKSGLHRSQKASKTEAKTWWNQNKGSYHAS